MLLVGVPAGVSVFFRQVVNHRFFAGFLELFDAPSLSSAGLSSLSEADAVAALPAGLPLEQLMPADGGSVAPDKSMPDGSQPELVDWLELTRFSTAVVELAGSGLWPDDLVRITRGAPAGGRDAYAWAGEGRAGACAPAGLH